MNKIQYWASNHQDIIRGYIDSKKYNDLLKMFEKESGLSQVKLAATLRCDRKSIRRYLNDERQVPMGLVSLLLKTLGIDYREIAEEKKEEAQDLDKDGSLIWYGGSEILLNTLYWHRIKSWKQSRFELACELNVNEETLAEYERGRKRIPYSVIQTILAKHQLKLTELFPTICSYDGGKTYMQLDIQYEQQFGKERVDIFVDEYYVGPNKEWFPSLPDWPAWRYDNFLKPMIKYMPNELTMDEYFNTDSLYFVNLQQDRKPNEKDEFYESPTFAGKKLPPSYKHIQDFYEQKDFSKEIVQFDLKIKSITLLPNYELKIISGTRCNTFDLKDYVFSDSTWYQMLKNETYFIQGILENGDDPSNACVRWPDGQYIRIVELYIDKYPYRHYRHAKTMTGKNWLVYE